jgi:transcriptional regulator with XRE-family HTH domain
MGSMDKFEAEVERILGLLRDDLSSKRISMRELERRLGAPLGTRRKILSGQTTLSYQRLLEILEAMGVSWEEFFQTAYGRPAQDRSPAPPAEPAQIQEVPGEELRISLSSQQLQELIETQVRLALTRLLTQGLGPL